MEENLQVITNANQLMEKADFEGAIKLYKLAKEKIGITEGITNNLSIALIRQNYLSEAADELSEYIENINENYEFLKRRFNIFRRLKKDQLAIDDLATLIKLRPEIIDNYRLLADYCITYHQYSKALDILRLAVEKSPTSFDITGRILSLERQICDWFCFIYI